MKKKMIKFVLMLIFLITVSFSATAQVYVKIRPTFPVTVRTQQHRSNQVWVDEDWQPRGRHYRYNGGRWVTPPHRGYVRKPGHWEQRRRGQVWIQGTWSRN